MNKQDVKILLDRWISEHRDEMTQELMEWVSHKSVSRADLCNSENKAPYGSDCREMLDFALKRAEEYGFRATDHDGYCGSAFYGDAEEEIGFATHLDVVPEGGDWIYKPYEPVLKDGFIIGRGVDDNKAAVVIGLYLMRFFKDNDIRLDKTFRLMMGCAEETGMSDFRHYIDEGGKVPAFSIVPDAPFPVCYAEKGNWDADILIPAGKNIKNFIAGNVRNAIPNYAELWIDGVSFEDVKTELGKNEKLEIREENDMIKIIGHGKGGHASLPDGTDNAIVIVAKAVAESRLTDVADLGGLRFIAETFATPYGDGMGFAFEDDITGKLTSNAGAVFKENDKLHLLLDVRLPVKADINKMTEEFLLYLKRNDAEMTCLKIMEPFFIEKEDPRVLTMMEAYRDVTGDYEKEPFSMGAGTYSRVIPNAITFGHTLRRVKADFLPEGHGGAHAPDEALHLDSWLTAFKIYALSVMKLCGAIET